MDLKALKIAVIALIVLNLASLVTMWSMNEAVGKLTDDVVTILKYEVNATKSAEAQRIEILQFVKGR